MSGLKHYLLLLGLTGTLMMSGCGSSGNDRQPPFMEPAEVFGSDENGIIYTGSGRCVTCHQDLETFVTEIESQTNAVIVDKYLNSLHVQGGTLTASAPSSCLECHDPIGDARTLERFLPSAAIPAGGLTAIGCESCHGAGGNHYGAPDTMPYHFPGAERCGSCHTNLDVSLSGHQGAFRNNIYQNYQDSKHVDSATLLASGTDPTACAQCHSDQGFRQYLVDLEDNQTPVLTNFDPTQSMDPVQCRTCHDPHSGALRATATYEDNRVVFSQEFNLCTACHLVLLDATFDQDAGIYNYIADNSDLPEHPAIGDMIASHFAVVDGYNINAAAQNACTKCHDPHGATKFNQPDVIEITKEWAQSGHGDYRSASFGSHISRDECLVCHSGLVFASFVDDSPSERTKYSGGPQVIGCIACHNLTERDGTGAFEPGNVRDVGQVTFPSGDVVDMGSANNLCLSCHQGRSSTPTVNDRIAAGNLTFSNIHYAPAGATLFGSDVQGGYEYEGRNYRNRNGFEIHAFAGAPELTNCAGCHMETADHSFEVNIVTCKACHPGGDTFQTLGTIVGGYAGGININYTRIEAFKDQLDEELTSSGVTKLDSYPYFSGITTEAQLKAAYNLQFAEKDKGGYIHNGLYLRQLLFDAIVDMGAEPVYSAP